MRVAALYRYPVKGFTPEDCSRLAILDSGRVAGDRVLGIRFANAAAADDAWGSKHEFVALVNTPGLARLELRFDHERLRLRASRAGAVLFDEPLTDSGRRAICAAIERCVLELAENPLTGQPQRLPLRLVGDGVTPRYQDSAADFVTLHGRESLAALAGAAGVPDLSELRFRSNIAIEGLAAWEEQRWAGRKIRIGGIDFEFARPKTRCLATHANPRTGERDLPVMKTLSRIYPSEKPTFAIALSTLGRGGTIRVGDRVSLAD
jgi:uncharacterized protein YcbX